MSVISVNKAPSERISLSHRAAATRVIFIISILSYVCFGFGLSGTADGLGDVAIADLVLQLRNLLREFLQGLHNVCPLLWLHPTILL